MSKDIDSLCKKVAEHLTSSTMSDPEDLLDCKYDIFESDINANYIEKLKVFIKSLNDAEKKILEEEFTRDSYSDAFAERVRIYQAVLNNDSAAIDIFYNELMVKEIIA